ncbi:DNA primase [compost metagenome]
MVTYNEKVIEDNISLIDYYNDFLVPLNPRLKRLAYGDKVALCLFHDDHDPSMGIWYAKKAYKCFACGAGGKIIKIHIMAMKRYRGEVLTEAEAIKKLAAHYKLDILEDNEIMEEDPFEKAKRLLGDAKINKIPKGVFTFAQFRQLNNRIKTTNTDVRNKVVNYDIIDIEAAIMTKREGK